MQWLMGRASPQAASSSIESSFGDITFYFRPLNINGGQQPRGLRWFKQPHRHAHYQMLHQGRVFSFPNPKQPCTFWMFLNKVQVKWKKKHISDKLFHGKISDLFLTKHVQSAILERFCVFVGQCYPQHSSVSITFQFHSAPQPQVKSPLGSHIMPPPPVMTMVFHSTTCLK